MKRNDNCLKKNIIIPFLISKGKYYLDSDFFVLINDKVLFNHPSWHAIINPSGAFNSLLWLYLYYEEVFPAECKLFFKGEEQQHTIKMIKKNMQEKNHNIYCLLEWGDVFLGYHHYQYSLEINKMKELPIKMSNWTQFVIEYSHDALEEFIIEEVIHPDHCLDMTPQQAFLLFANNCVAYFDCKAINENLDFEEISDITNTPKEQEKNNFLFVKEYLSWLKRELDKGTIHPLQLLQYNGHNTLSLLLDQPAVQEFVLETYLKLQNFKKLTKFEQVLFYNFYEKIHAKKYAEALVQRGIINLVIFSF